MKLIRQSNININKVVLHFLEINFEVSCINFFKFIDRLNDDAVEDILKYFIDKKLNEDFIDDETYVFIQQLHSKYPNSFKYMISKINKELYLNDLKVHNKYRFIFTKELFNNDQEYFEFQIDNNFYKLINIDISKIKITEKNILNAINCSINECNPELSSIIEEYLNNNIGIIEENSLELSSLKNLIYRLYKENLFVIKYIKNIKEYRFILNSFLNKEDLLYVIENVPKLKDSYHLNLSLKEIPLEINNIKFILKNTSPTFYENFLKTNLEENINNDIEINNLFNYLNELKIDDEFKNNKKNIDELIFNLKNIVKYKNKEMFDKIFS